MYGWKCWREARGRLILYWCAAVALGVLFGLEAADHFWWYRWARTQEELAHMFRAVWRGTSVDLQWHMSLGALWMGLALAATGLGRDYGSAAAPFLLTRPRARRRLLWSDGSVAMSGAWLACLLLFLAAVLTMVRSTPWTGDWAMLGILPVAFAVAFVVYALAVLLAVLARSAVKGVELAIAVLLIVNLLPGALHEWWHILWLQRWHDRAFLIFDWAGRRTYYRAVDGQLQLFTTPYPWLPLAGWFACGLGLMLLAQRLVERREI